MQNDIITVIVTIITVLGGAGAWKFYATLVKTRRESHKDSISEHNVYRDDLRARVEKLEQDKDKCSEELMKISIELAELKAKIKYLNK